LNSASPCNLYKIRVDRHNTLQESGKDILHLKSLVAENLVGVKRNVNLRTEIYLVSEKYCFIFTQAMDKIDKVHNCIATHYLCDLQAMKLFVCK